MQYIAAYKYELGTLLATLNMCQFVLQRPRLLQQQQPSTARGGVHKPVGATAALTGSGERVAAASLGSRLLPKPSLGRAAAAGAAAGKAVADRSTVRSKGFSMQSVLSAVGRGSEDGAEGLPPAPQQQQQRSPVVIQPKSPSSKEHCACCPLLLSVVLLCIAALWCWQCKQQAHQ